MSANLGVNYRDAGRIEEAIPLLEESHRASRQHASLQWVSRELLITYLQARRKKETQSLIADLVSVARKTHASGSAELATFYGQYGALLLSHHAYVEAEVLLRECIAIREKSSPDHWVTFSTFSLLGGALLGQKKYTEAEPVLLKSYQGLVERAAKIPPASKALIRGALDRLVQLFTATGNLTELKKWQIERKTMEKPKAGQATRSAN